VSCIHSICIVSLNGPVWCVLLQVAGTGQQDSLSETNSYLDASLRTRLANDHSVQCSTVVQCLGDTIFIPAMAPYQVSRIWFGLVFFNDSLYRSVTDSSHTDEQRTAVSDCAVLLVVFDTLALLFGIPTPPLTWDLSTLTLLSKLISNLIYSMVQAFLDPKNSFRALLILHNPCRFLRYNYFTLHYIHLTTYWKFFSVCKMLYLRNILAESLFWENYFDTWSWTRSNTSVRVKNFQFGLMAAQSASLTFREFSLVYTYLHLQENFPKLHFRK